MSLVLSLLFSDNWIPFFGKQRLDVLVLYGRDIVAGEKVLLMLLQPQHCSPHGGYFQDGAKKKLLTKSILIQSAQISSQKQKEKLRVIPMFIIVSLHQQEIFPYFSKRYYGLSNPAVSLQSDS